MFSGASKNAQNMFSGASVLTSRSWWKEHTFVRSWTYSVIFGFVGATVFRGWQYRVRRTKEAFYGAQIADERKRLESEATALKANGLPLDTLRKQRIELLLQMMSDDKFPLPDEPAAAADAATADAAAATADGDEVATPEDD